jgi:selenocysteine-specific elongation factor
MPIIMGTAGHIDHGKTTLIRALSGIDCDRLKDEKKRGITIELGFAFLDLPGGERLGIVDVPGHEKFVKNMVAGAAGIDFVLLTVAADEGVMPQTREHLEICSLLGIDNGLVALTKTDSVDEELLELATEDIKDFLSQTFLADAPIIPVSAHTGEGIEDLRDALREKARGLGRKEKPDIFRLPVDRVFTMRGHGTVVTGTLASGEVSLGDAVVAHPRERRGKVRGIQVHGQSEEKVSAGRRTALNLAGVEVEDLQRGDTLAHPGRLLPETAWDVEITCLSSAPRPLKHKREVHFHHGTREILARVHLLDAEELPPGETALAQIRFPFPMVGVFGDRFVVRAHSPLRTIAGGKLLNPIGRKVKRFSSQLDPLYTLARGDPQTVLLTHLELSGNKGLDSARLQVLCNLSAKELNKLLQDLGSKQRIFCFDRENRVYVSGGVVQRLTADLEEYVRRFHRDNPLQAGISRGRVASDWGKDLPAKLLHFILERCQKLGLLVSEQEVLRLPEHRVTLGQDQSKLKESILRQYRDAGITPPNLNDVLQDLDIDAKQATPILQLLTEEGKLIKIKDGMYYSAEALERVRELVLGYFAENEELGPKEFKELTGLSRKYSIPLLEYLDKARITIRVGDVRKLRKGQNSSRDGA